MKLIDGTEVLADISKGDHRWVIYRHGRTKNINVLIRTPEGTVSSLASNMAAIVDDLREKGLIEPKGSNK